MRRKRKASPPEKISGGCEQRRRDRRRYRFIIHQVRV
jgi:hypothetical protein